MRRRSSQPPSHTLPPLPFRARSAGTVPTSHRTPNGHNPHVTLIVLIVRMLGNCFFLKNSFCVSGQFFGALGTKILQLQQQSSPATRAPNPTHSSGVLNDNPPPHPQGFA